MPSSATFPPIIILSTMSLNANSDPDISRPISKPSFNPISFIFFEIDDFLGFSNSAEQTFFANSNL